MLQCLVIVGIQSLTAHYGRGARLLGVASLRTLVKWIERHRSWPDSLDELSRPFGRATCATLPLRALRRDSGLDAAGGLRICRAAQDTGGGNSMEPWDFRAPAGPAAAAAPGRRRRNAGMLGARRAALSSEEGDPHARATALLTGDGSSSRCCSTSPVAGHNPRRLPLRLARLRCRSAPPALVPAPHSWLVFGAAELPATSSSAPTTAEASVAAAAAASAVNLGRKSPAGFRLPQRYHLPTEHTQLAKGLRIEAQQGSDADGIGARDAWYDTLMSRLERLGQKHAEGWGPPHQGGCAAGQRRY